nr:two-component regulator propeller domain-containing protein [uncultured Carboxylicivirga sp.]
MRKFLLLTIVTIWFSFQTISGQHYHFKQYSLEEGLPQSEIYGLVEDQFGYIWVGTNGGGLCRFNGMGFEDFTRKDGLLDNIVLGLHHDENYNLWIGTPKGIQKFDGTRFTTILESDSTLFNNRISFCEIGENNLWCITQFVTGKQVIYKIENDSLINYSEKFEEELGDNFIFRIVADRESNLLIATRNNLYKYNGQTLDIVDTKPLGIDSKAIKYPLFVDRNNQMWCMLFYHEGKTELVVHKSANKIEKIPVPNKIKGKTIFDGFEDRTGSLWFLIENGGVLNYSKRGWRLFDKSNGLPIEMVYKIHEDAEGNIWMGTIGGGLVRYNGDLFTSLNHTSGLTDDMIRSIYQDSKGTLYFADGDGGFTTLNNGKIKQYPDKSIADFGSISSFLELPNGKTLIGSHNGLFSLNGNSAKPVNTSFGWKKQLPINGIVQIKDTTFFATLGYGLIKSVKGKATLFNSYNSKLPSNTITNLFVDSKSRLWVSTTRGITQYFNGSFSEFPEQKKLSTSYVLQAAEDASGQIWFASFTKGLIIYNNKNWTTFDTSNGLSSDNIYSIISDNKGNIWAGAQNGVDKLSISNTGEVKAIDYFDRHDGFVGIENNSSANFKDNEGKLWFGTVKGVMCYNPSERRINYLPPPVYIRNIELSYKKPTWYSDEYKTRYDSLVPWFGIPNSLTLPKEQNNISFTFDALCYTTPEKIKYKWRLEPIENEWVYGNTNEVAYPSLPPGDYTFRVTAANNNGIWNEEGAIYNFSIHPAWYQTFAFKVIIAALVIMVVLLLIFVWMQNVKKLRFEMETLVVAKTKEITSQKAQIEAKNKELENQKEKISKQTQSITASFNDLEKLTDIGKKLTANLSINRIFDLVYKATSEIMDTYLFGFALYNNETNSLDFQNVILQGERIPFLTFSVDDTERLSIHCLLNDKEIFIRDFDQEYKQYVNEIRPVPGDINSKSIIYIPIKVNEAPFGVLTVQSAKLGAYNGYHLNFVRNIAIYTSIALENANTFKQLKQQQKDLQLAKETAISQKEQMEKQRDDLDRLYEENNHLIRLFTTELEKPITSSLSIANTLQGDDNISLKEMNEAMAKILESLWQIKDMLNQVSEIKRLENEDFQINKSKISLPSLLKEVKAQYQEYLDNKNIEVIWDLSDVIVESDYTLLEKIFSNLLSNAIKFSEPQTNVTINCYEDDKMVTIGVRDEGPGMTEEDQEKLFTKFNKLSNKNSNKVSSGLGLYIVKRYIDSLNGHISCTSHVGIGTTFYVRLPK